MKTGSLPIRKLLLDNDADPRPKESHRDGKSSLHLAARLGMTDVVESILDWGADLSDVDEQGKTALFWPIEASNPAAGYDILRLLVRKGLDVNKKDQNGRNILQEAAQRGNSMAVEALIGRVDHSLKDAKGKTPLDYAHEGGHEDTERILREWNG